MPSVDRASYVFLKNFQDFSRTFSSFFSQDFSSLGNYFFIFQVFQGAWEP